MLINFNNNIGGLRMKKKIIIGALFITGLFFIFASKNTLNVRPEANDQLNSIGQNNEIVDEGINKYDEKTVEEIPILMYHHISKDPSSWNSIIISPEKFEEDMLYLKAMGYNTIHFKEYVAYKEKGGELPEKPIIITLDDGYESNFLYAYPLLKELNMKATISVIGNLIGLKQETGLSYLDWEQMKEMYDSGVIEIQHHSYSLHQPGEGTYKGGAMPMTVESPDEYRERFTKDTLKLKNEIEKILGNEVIVYTYPYGFYNEKTEEILKELGFKFSLTVEEGLGQIANGYALKRINVPSSMPSIKLIKTLQKLQGKKEKIIFQGVKDQGERIEKLRQELSYDS